MGCKLGDPGMCESCDECMKVGGWGFFIESCYGHREGRCHPCEATCGDSGRCSDTEHVVNCGGFSEGEKKSCSDIVCQHEMYLLGCGHGYTGECVRCPVWTCEKNEKLVGCGANGSGVCVACEVGDPDSSCECPIGTFYSSGECFCGPGYHPTGTNIKTIDVENVYALTDILNGQCEPCPVNSTSNGIGYFGDSSGGDRCIVCGAATYDVNGVCRDCPTFESNDYTVVPSGQRMPGGKQACMYSCESDKWWKSVPSLGRVAGCEKCQAVNYCEAGQYLLTCEPNGKYGDPVCLPCAKAWRDSIGDDPVIAEYSKYTVEWIMPGEDFDQAIEDPSVINQPWIGDSMCLYWCNVAKYENHGIVVSFNSTASWVFISDALGIRQGIAGSHMQGGVNSAKDPGFTCGWMCEPGYVRVENEVGVDSLGLVSGRCERCGHSLCDSGHFYGYALHSGNLSSGFISGECPSDNTFSEYYDWSEFGGSGAAFIREWSGYTNARSHCRACDVDGGVVLPASGVWHESGGCSYGCLNGDEDVGDDSAIFDEDRCEWKCSSGKIFGAVGRIYEHVCWTCHTAVQCETGEYLESCDGDVTSRAKCIDCKLYAGGLGVGERWVEADEMDDGQRVGPFGVCKKTCLSGYIGIDGEDGSNGCMLCPEDTCSDDGYIPVNALSCSVSGCVSCRECIFGDEWMRHDCGGGHNRDCVGCRVCGMNEEYEAGACRLDRDRECRTCNDCPVGMFWEGGCGGYSGDDGETLVALTGGDGDRRCEVCAAGWWCSGNFRHRCPAESMSDGGASRAEDCICEEEGHWVRPLDGAVADGCELRECDVDYYRVGIGCHRCPSGSSTRGVRGVAGVFGCYCDGGFYRDASSVTLHTSGDVLESFQCVVCTSSCPGIENLGRGAGVCGGGRWQIGGVFALTVFRTVVLLGVVATGTGGVLLSVTGGLVCSGKRLRRLLLRKSHL